MLTPYQSCCTNIVFPPGQLTSDAILDAKLVSRVIGVLKGSFEPVFTTLRYCVPLFLSMMLAEAMAGSPDAIKSNVLLLLMSYCGTVNQVCCMAQLQISLSSAPL